MKVDFIIFLNHNEGRKVKEQDEMAIFTTEQSETMELRRTLLLVAILSCTLLICIGAWLSKFALNSLLMQS